MAVTIAELELSLPNGFHDAFLTWLQVDFLARTAFFFLQLDVSETDTEVSTKRRATLSVTGLHTFRCDGALMPQELSGRPLRVSGFNPTAAEFTGFDTLTPELRAKAFGFYVSDWNGFFCLIGDDASISWE